MSSLGASVLKRITPECSALGPTLLLSGIVQTVMTLVSMIVLLASVIYKFAHKPTTDTDKEKKNKVLKWSTTFATVISTITAFIAIWHIIIAGKVKRCISDNN